MEPGRGGLQAGTDDGRHERVRVDAQHHGHRARSLPPHRPPDRQGPAPDQVLHGSGRRRHLDAGRPPRRAAARLQHHPRRGTGPRNPPVRGLRREPGPQRRPRCLLRRLCTPPVSSSTVFRHAVVLT